MKLDFKVNYVKALYYLNRIPSALLLSGKDINIKFKAAIMYSKWLLCLNKENEECNKCDSCLAFNAGNHSQHLLLRPKAINGLIKVEDIELVINLLKYNYDKNLRFIIIIMFIDVISPKAVNMLLSILEEPNSNALFILITKNDLTLRTIVTRCHSLEFCSDYSHSHDIKNEIIYDLNRISEEKNKVTIIISEKWNRMVCTLSNKNINFIDLLWIVISDIIKRVSMVGSFIESNYNNYAFYKCSKYQSILTLFKVQDIIIDYKKNVLLGNGLSGNVLFFEYIFSLWIKNTMIKIH